MSQPERPRSGPKRVMDRYNTKPMGAAYQGAMESVFSIVIGVLLGWWADHSFDTAPWGVLAGATIGFGAFVLRLSRLGAALNAPTGDDEPPEGDANEGDAKRTAPSAAAATDATRKGQDGES